MAGQSLRAYSCGLIAFMLIKVLAPGYFARQDMKTPVKIAIQAMVANMVFNLALIYPFAHVGLAAATAMSAFLNAFLLLYGLLKIGVFQWQSGWGIMMVRLVVACLVLLVTMMYFDQNLQQWLDWSVWQRVMNMGVIVVLGVASYLFVLIALGVRKRHLTAH